MMNLASLISKNYLKYTKIIFVHLKKFKRNKKDKKIPQQEEELLPELKVLVVQEKRVLSS